MRTVLVISYHVLGLLSAPATTRETLEVHTAWIREAPPTARVLAAYMVIENTGESPAGIMAIASPDFEHTELHHKTVESGIARMVPIDKLEIPAGEQISLEPGGIHLLLINPLRPLREGDKVTLTIQGADGLSKSFMVPVIRETGDAVPHQYH